MASGRMISPNLINFGWLLSRKYWIELLRKIFRNSLIKSESNSKNHKII
jgi:hypothetical protein